MTMLARFDLLPLAGQFPIIAPAQLWEAASYRLITLAEILEFYTAIPQFVDDNLRHHERLWVQIADIKAKESELPDAEREQFRGKFAEEIKILSEFLAVVGKFCTVYNLPGIPCQINRICDELDKQNQAVAEISVRLKTLREGIADALKSYLFLHVPPKMVVYYNGNDLFGQAVARKMPKLSADVAGAGKCLALGQFTAAVFHLMRVMELGVRRFAKRAGVSSNLITGKTWGQVLREINSRIVAMPHQTPAQKEHKELFADVASHLRNVKDAWRDQVMHPNRTFSDDEAKAIFDNVKAFIQQLPSILR